MTLNTVQNAIDQSGGHLRFDSSSAEGPATPLATVRHLIVNLHDRPLIQPRGLWKPPDLSALPDRLRGFLQTPLGHQLLQFGQFRADGGAREICLALAQRFAQAGEPALMISPAAVGRGILDLNRPREKAIELPFPEEIQGDLLSVYDQAMQTLWEVYRVLQPHLVSVLQPHTMASGELTEEEGKEIEALEAIVKEALSRGGSAAYEEAMGQFITLWADMYTRMCNRRERAKVDIVAGLAKKDASKDRIPDHGFAEALGGEFNSLHIPWAINDPFPHVEGYPCTILARAAGAADLVQGTFDVPRDLLLEGEGAEQHYQALAFHPDESRVRIFADAVFQAVVRTQG